MSIERKKKHMWIVLLLILSLACLLTYFIRRDSLEFRIICAIDQQCETEVDWDTVSIFIAGDSLEILEDLGVHTEFEDGIVFSRNNEP